MKRFVQAIDHLTERVGQATTWLSSLLVLVVCYDVFTRYLLNKSTVAVQELEWHIFAILFLLAMPYGFKYDRHVRVDVLYTRFSPRTRQMINFWGTILFLIPFSMVVIWASAQFVWSSFLIRETSPDPGGLPARYLIKLIIPISFFLLFLQGVGYAIKTGQQLFKKG